MMRKSLFLILTLALLSVPVFLMAHAFTHLVQVNAIGVAGAESLHTDDDEIDIDDVCFDCLALTTLITLLITSGFFLADLATRQLSAQPKTRLNSHKKHSSYCPRAPPLAS